MKFQQSFRPSGTLEEVKKYFSGKHKLYGFKVEVSVLPNGLAISASVYYPGSVADIEIMRHMMVFHDDALKKTESEKAITAIGRSSDRFPNSWAVLLDKGYTGIDTDVRAIIPKKKPRSGILSIPDRKEIEKISSDGVIVENYFGRQGELWPVVSNKFRWKEDSYDSIFRLTIALTNIHIKWHPLRDADGALKAQRGRHRLVCRSVRRVAGDDDDREGGLAARGGVHEGVPEERGGRDDVGGGMGGMRGFGGSSVARESSGGARAWKQEAEIG